MEKLKQYLDEAVKFGEIKQSTSELALQALSSLPITLPIPDTGIIPDGVLFMWDKGVHHGEIEVYASGRAKLFYINAKTNYELEREFIVGKSVPRKLVDNFKFLAA